jgi:hypothetical protein
MLVVRDSAPASDRSPTNGFRCADYGGAQLSEKLAGPADPDNRTGSGSSRAIRDVPQSVPSDQRTVERAPGIDRHNGG